MSNADFKDYYQRKLSVFETYLRQGFPQLPSAVDQLAESMRYSLYAGGKRIRPILLLATIESDGLASDFALPFASAIEYIHTYSLIHDDLPCMDDDDLRRGQPTNHIRFGEAVALLAGDALLTHAFALISHPNLLHTVPAESILQAIHVLAEAAGVHGMVTGQVADISAPFFEKDADSLDFIHRHKTGAMITAAVHIGAILAGFDPNTVKQLQGFGRELGKCFQIQDDILDEIGEERVLGKSPGRDRKNKTLTFPRAFGLEKTKMLASQSHQDALAFLDRSGLEAERLRQIADFILQRER
jgi:geranylgeranyl diphosphate synthase, type II